MGEDVFYHEPHNGCYIIKIGDVESVSIGS